MNKVPSTFRCPDLASARVGTSGLDKPSVIAAKTSVDKAWRLVQEVKGTRISIPPADSQQRRVLRKLHEQGLTAAVWQDGKAGEHHQQTFALARQALDEQLQALPKGTTPVLITDVDDMLVDSHIYFNGFMRQSCRMSDERSLAWWMDQPSQPLDGAKEFLEYAVAKGVHIHYVTARINHPEVHKQTVKLLQNLHFPDVDDRHVHIASDKLGKAQQITEKLAEQGKPAQVIFAGGDKCTDIGFPRNPTRKSKQQWIDNNLAKVGKQFFIQPNTIYGPWETTLQGKYEHLPLAEASQRCRTIHKLAGEPDCVMKTTTLEQGQALLYSCSTERDLALRQVLVHGENYCQQAHKQGHKPVVHVQLEGVLANTSAYVAERIVNGEFADQAALERGALTDWLAYGAAHGNGQVVKFLKRMRAEHNADVVYSVTVPKGCDPQQYAAKVCQWLKQEDIDDQPRIDTRPDLSITKDQGDSNQHLYLLTQRPEQKLASNAVCYIVPAPHQLWEWWHNDAASTESTVDQLQHYVRRWQMPEECTSGASRVAMEAQHVREVEDEIQGSDVPLWRQPPPKRRLPLVPKYSESRHASPFLHIAVKPRNVSNAR